MAGYQQRIQGTDRLLRIRRMRRMVYLALLVLTVLLMYARIMGEGASLKPIFIPLDGLLEIGLIMGLVGTIIGVYLRNLEIQRAQTDSQRYLMSRYSMSRALTTAIFALVLGVLLIFPGTASGLGSALTDPPRTFNLAPNNMEIVNLSTPDAFGVSFIREVDVSVTAGSVEVTVYKNSVAQPGSATVSPSGSATFPIEPGGWTSLASWSVTFKNVATTGTVNAVVTYSLPLGILPALFFTIPFLFFLFFAANIGWWYGLRPIRERTKTAALYASSASAAEIGAGERAYIEYAMQPQPRYVMENPTADPPPPPPAAPPPPPPGPAPVAAAPAPAAVLKPAAPAETADSFALKGNTLASIEQYPSAVAAYDEALRLDPNRIPVLISRAAALAAMRRPDAALDAYRRVLALDPSSDVALRESGKLLAGQARWRESLETLDLLLKRRPNDVPALGLKGDVLTNLGRRPEALAAYEAAQALDPSDANLRQKIEEVRVDVPGLLSRALIASASGNYSQALALYDDILEVEPSNVNALIGKAVAYRRSGKASEALNCLDMVLNYQPTNASALLNRGNLLVERGDVDGALEAFTKLVSISPQDEEAWVAQGDAFVKIGRDDDALRAFQEAMKINPGDEEIHSRIRDIESSKTVSSDILQELYRVKGVGPARAKALLEAGFRTPEDFRKATLEQLLTVKGITHKIAEDLAKHFAAALPVRAA